MTRGRGAHAILAPLCPAPQPAPAALPFGGSVPDAGYTGIVNRVGYNAAPPPTRREGVFGWQWRGRVEPVSTTNRRRCGAAVGAETRACTPPSTVISSIKTVWIAAAASATTGCRPTTTPIVPRPPRPAGDRPFACSPPNRAWRRPGWSPVRRAAAVAATAAISAAAGAAARRGDRPDRPTAAVPPVRSEP